MANQIVVILVILFVLVPFGVLFVFLLYNWIMMILVKKSLNKYSELKNSSFIFSPIKFGLFNFIFKVISTAFTFAAFSKEKFKKSFQLDSFEEKVVKTKDAKLVNQVLRLINSMRTYYWIFSYFVILIGLLIIAAILYFLFMVITKP